MELVARNLKRVQENMVCGEAGKVSGILKRRSVVLSGASLVSSAVLGSPGDGLAVIKQGLLAGRVPGWRTYRRPDEKSGGHGVVWSPIIPYLFSVPQGWEEVPVSIADLGGTEIDLRFGSANEGRLSVILAPVLRFLDNFDGDATIEKIGRPETVINAFGPEVIGENVEGKVMSINVVQDSGRTYYQYELEPPYVLITETCSRNLLYLFNVTGSGLQWKRHYKDLKKIADSFRYCIEESKIKVIKNLSRIERGLKIHGSDLNQDKSLSIAFMIF
uniref:psbP domain-containing protein 4, chloroplastic-like n=1 Tax=Fragaria vesca subsp. vesca TaxID=101020 RepID=UPI0005C937E2|nr:PREDICTED: psbP domain-containing protein 4, chloroplastic-like [Fragaria vesca subsp. vesca]